jgi:hypothetical protein
MNQNNCNHDKIKDVYYVNKKGKRKYDYSYCKKCGRSIITDGRPVYPLA